MHEAVDQRLDRYPASPNQRIVFTSSRADGRANEQPMTGLSLSVQTYGKNNPPGRRQLNEYSDNRFSVKLA